MDTDTREAIAALDGRMTRYFELQRAEILEWREEMRNDMRNGFAGVNARLDALTARVDRLETEVERLQNELTLLRDFVTREFAEVRLELRELRAQADQNAEFRREVAALTARVDRLERGRS